MLRISVMRHVGWGGEKVKDSAGKNNKKVENVSTAGIQYGLRMVRDLQIC